MMNQVVSEALPLLVDARTAARMLGISPRTLYDLLRDGQIPSVKLQGRRLFSVSALSKWIEERLSFGPPQGRQGRRRKDGQSDGQSAQRAKARGQQRE